MENSIQNILNHCCQELKSLVQLPLSFLILFFIGITPSSSGQPFSNPNILPLGDDEPLMANTGTGGLESNGSVYYNPAALAMLKGNSFALTGTAYLLFSFESNPIARIENNNLNYSGKGFRTIPTSLIIVRRFKELRLAFSVLQPQQFDFEGPYSWQVPISNDILNFDMNQNYSERMQLIGLSAARPVNEHWSVGLSAYAQNYAYLAALNFRGALTSLPETINTIEERHKRTSLHMLLIAGIHRTSPDWNLGLRLSLPNIRISSNGTYHYYEYNNLDGAGNVKVTYIDYDKLQTHIKTPFDIRLGMTLTKLKNWTLAMDVSYGLGVKYRVYNVPSLPDSIDANATYRISLGAERVLNKTFSLHAGGSYNPTSTNILNGEYKIENWSVVGGVKLSTEHIVYYLGYFYALGKSDNNPLVGGGNSEDIEKYNGIFFGTKYRF